jgi:hypothetical protein
MKQIILLSILAFLFSGCLNEELSPLEENVFETRGVFRLVNIERDTTSEVRANITLNFTTVYEGARQEQKDKVTGILVTGPRNEMRQVIAPDATSFVMRNVRFDWQQCVTLFFVTTERQRYSQSVEICALPD